MFFKKYIIIARGGDYLRVFFRGVSLTLAKKSIIIRYFDEIGAKGTARAFYTVRYGQEGSIFTDMQ